MRTIAIINLKGGVAKTTSSINIAYILNQKGYKVLLVDNDKQGDCSRGLDRRSPESVGIDEIMTEEDPDMEKLIQNTNYEKLDIITANLNLLKANLEASMDLTRVQQTRLKKAVERVKEDYDFCVIDNAPDINISVINALAAADDVLIPIEIDDNTTESMGELLKQIDTIKRDWNPEMKNVKCFISRYDRYNEAHTAGAEIIRECYRYSRRSGRSAKNNVQPYNAPLRFYPV